MSKVATHCGDVNKPDDHRSGCPINLTLEILGDKWSLIVIRDIIMGDRRYFRELLTNSIEGIASNILADRLQRLVEQQIITKSEDPSHKQKVRYSLTEAGIQLLPVLVQIGAWGRSHLPASEELSVRAELLERGGPRMWSAFMAELRAEHLGKKRRGDPASVRAEIERAYQRFKKRKGAKEPV